MLSIYGWGISLEIAHRCLSQDFTDDKSTLVQVMAWCRQAPSHYRWLGLVPSGNKPLLESHATTWHHQATMLYGNITLTRLMIVPQSLPNWFRNPNPRLPHSVVNTHRSVGPRPTTLEKERELFVDFSSISCLWFEIQGMRTDNFFDWNSNTASMSYLFSSNPKESQ